MEITVTVNGAEQTVDVEPRMLLADFIRTELGLTGTHIGCDTTSCGVCTVLLDGTPVKSCTVFAVQADGRSITTVEGMRDNGELSAMQKAFKEEHGLQCGFCTPAMMLVGTHLIENNPDPSEDDIRWAISGNLCRCTGYMNIVKAIQAAAGAGAVSAAAASTTTPVTADHTGGSAAGAGAVSAAAASTTTPVTADHTGGSAAGESKGVPA